MYFFIIIASVAIDQITKAIIRTVLSLGESIPVLGDFLTITLHYNTGAAFSLMEGYKVFLTVLPAVMIVLIFIYIGKRRRVDSSILLTALSLIAGGGTGNLIDRLVMGKVTDFISVGTFPVFNFADMCVVSGCGLVVVYLLFFDKGKKDVKDGASKRA